MSSSWAWCRVRGRPWVRRCVRRRAARGPVEVFDVGLDAAQFGDVHHRPQAQSSPSMLSGARDQAGGEHVGVAGEVEPDFALGMVSWRARRGIDRLPVVEVHPQPSSGAAGGSRGGQAEQLPQAGWRPRGRGRSCRVRSEGAGAELKIWPRGVSGFRGRPWTAAGSGGDVAVGGVELRAPICRRWCRPGSRRGFRRAVAPARG